jgi:alanine racemase
VHPNLKPWDQLTAEEQARDKAQVHASIDIGRMMHRAGFVKREVVAAST